MIREVITYPNKLLRLKSKDVEQFDEELHTLLDDMYDTMMAQGGVGLAAIQIAIPLNVLIINLPNEEDIQEKDELIEAKNAIIIQKDGINDYIGTEHFILKCLGIGRQIKWKILGQELINLNNTKIDKIKIETEELTESEIITQIENYYFDITECFGNGDQ